MEAGVFGPSALSVIMAGKNYKRCGLAHTLTFESLTRLHIKAFLTWLIEEEKLPTSKADEIEGIMIELQSVMGELLSNKDLDRRKHELLLTDWKGYMKSCKTTRHCWKISMNRERPLA